MVKESSNADYQNVQGWQEKVILFFEQFSNFAFYILALFIILIPPLKWVSDLFPSTDSGWWVIGSIIVFVIVIPLLAEPVANALLDLLKKFRDGQLLSVVFKPLKSIFAVASIYGVMVLEYKVIHGETESTLIEVFFELLKSF